MKLSLILLILLYSINSIANHKIIVKLKNGFFERNSINKTNVISIDRPFKLLKNLSVINLKSSKSAGNLLLNLQNHPDVEYAEPVYKWSTDSVRIPNDPKFNRQWNLYNVGQTFGKKGADINALEAWSEVRSNNEIVVAVVDSGLDYYHEDIEGNIFQNLKEINGVLGVDDDNNGFIDDFFGWNFVNNNNDPLDKRGHGTHISGIIAAKKNNGKGVAGISPTSKIMPLKVMDDNGYGDTDNIIKAIEYAIMNGAKVINNSYGSNQFSQAVEDIIKAARDNNILFVASAGNASANNDLRAHYPSDYQVENIISVAASNERDKLCAFSNFGLTTVHLSAPGAIILSLRPKNRYDMKSGTSQAAPHVVGVAALLLTQNINLNVFELKKAILDGVDKLDSFKNKTISGGRLNALNSLNLIR